MKHMTLWEKLIQRRSVPKELEENILMQLELVGLKTLEGVMWNLAQLDIGVNLRM